MSTAQKTLEHRLEEATRIILGAFDDPQREGLKETPRRVAKAWIELLTPHEPNLTVFQSNGYDQMIVSKEIQYHTFCEHHLIPFFGTVSIGYIPQGKIVGISKLARVVGYFARRLNTQEYFTQNVADYLQERLEPRGIGVIVKGRHLCQEMRGVKKKAEMVTSALHGLFKEDARTREEFLALVRNTRGEV